MRRMYFSMLSALAVVQGAVAGEIATQPWLQNVYTNRFTVMCETAGQMEGLVLQYGENFANVAAMTCTNGLSEGTWVYRAAVDGLPTQGARVPYRLATNGVALADCEGAVRLWKDEDVPFTCAIWGDNQEGVQEFDWGNDDVDERYRCIRQMFRHMAAQKPDFGFTTGDLSSHALYDEEVEPGELRGVNDLFGRTIPYHLVWGNHDCIGTFLGDSFTNAVQRYFSPAASEEEGWFHLYRNDVLFIGIHWTWGSADAEERYGQIAKEVEALLATDRAKAAKFRILFQHAPMYLECWNVLPKMNWFSDTRLLDVAKAGKVDVVFSGHTHAYERIERDGIVQIVNGGMGYLDHGERWYNNYGSDTKTGGHNDIPYLWARQVSTNELALGAMEPVRMGCLHGYGMLSVEGDTLTYREHAFNADGSYIGVADSFMLKSKTRQEDKVGGGGQSNVTPFTPSALSPVDNATWAAYKAVIGEMFEYPAGEEARPVVNVSKSEIERFCAVLNEGGGHHYRLPTVDELRVAFGGDLRREVSEWTRDVDPLTGRCRILGGNSKAVDGTWCRPEDRPEISTADCHAKYLGFRVIDEPDPTVLPSEMDRALAALAAIGSPAEVYEWNGNALVDITEDWKDEKLTTKYTYTNPVIFTGSGDLEYLVHREVVFGGGLAAPNATSLDVSHALELGLVSKPVTIRGEFRGGVSPDEWRFYLKCDELTLDNVTYRGQVFNAATDSRAITLVGTNDFSGAVMSICIDKVLVDPKENFVTKLMAADDASLVLRRLDFSNRGVVEEVIGQKTAGFAVGANVALTTAEDIRFGIKDATLTVDGTLKAAGVNLQGHLLGLLKERATVGGAGRVETTHFGMCAKSGFTLGVSNIVLRSSEPWRCYVPCEEDIAYEIIGGRVAVESERSWELSGADRFGWPYAFAGEEGTTLALTGMTPVTFLPAACSNTLEVCREVTLGGGEDPSYAAEEDAIAAAKVAMVARPNANVKAVVSAPEYDAMFDKRAMRRAEGDWTVEAVLSDATTDEVRSAIDAAEVRAALVETVTNETPRTVVLTKAGLYYGIAGATEVDGTGSAVLDWTLGDGREKEIIGARPEGATDRVFYWLWVKDMQF